MDSGGSIDNSVSSCPVEPFRVVAAEIAGSSESSDKNASNKNNDSCGGNGNGSCDSMDNNDICDSSDS
jgi:hypothetical protein